jgi:hypothetical protein
VVLIIIGIIAAIFAYVTYRSGVAEKRILLSVISRSRLLSAPKPMREDLKITYEGLDLADPNVIALEIENVGKSHINSQDFDQGRSLSFGLDAPIVKILSSRHRPNSAPSPRISVEDNEVKLGPELIAKGEVIEIAILADGPVGNIEVALDPIGDADVQIRDRETWLAQRSRRRVRIALAGATAVTAFLVAATIYTTIADEKSLALGKSSAILSSCSGLIQDTEGTGFALTVASGDIIATYNKSTGKSQVSIAHDYKQDVTDVEVQSRDMKQSFVAVQNAGIALGTSASIPAKVDSAMTVLKRLPSEKASAKSLKDFDSILSTSVLLTSSHAIPSGCA